MSTHVEFGALPSRGPDLFVEDLNAAEAAEHIGPWRDLAQRCLEPNAYFEPDFALAAASFAGPRLRLVLVWSTSGQTRGELLALWPITVPRAGVPLSVAHLWLHKNSTSATPWLDRREAEVALRAVLAHCRRRWPTVGALCIGSNALNGPLFALLRSQMVPLRVYGTFQRAVVSQTSQAAPGPQRTLRKCARRLEQLGRVEFRIATHPNAVEVAIESFLQLEASGWKAGRGAFASRPELATFARTSMVALARTGRGRIISLAVGDRIIAMGLVLVSGRRAFYWKTAYDETYAAYSPGALLSLHLTRALAGDASIDSADSCACADHPMIDRLWSERAPIATVFIGLRGPRVFHAAVAASVLWMDGRARLKAAGKRLLRR